MINHSKASIAVSIHQNSYQTSDVKGAQVFYFTHSVEGKKAAEILQKHLKTVDETNRREAKPNDTYYILKKNRNTNCDCRSRIFDKSRGSCKTSR